MKSIKYILVALSAGVMLFTSVGCQSQLDIQRDDRVPSSRSVYERLSRVYEQINSTYYAPVESGAQGFTAGGYMMAGYCDEAQEVAQSSSVYNWYNGRVSASSMPLWTNSDGGGLERWAGLFGSIRNCNEALMHLQDPTLKKDYQEAQQFAATAQFYALRAYSYLLLIKRWGGVPILRDALLPGHDYSQDKRASFAQCVDFIIESCDAALAADPQLSWFNGSSPYYPQICRATLWAIKSEAALYAASPLWADDHAGTEPYTWERAAAITKQALDLTLGHGGNLVNATTSFPATSASGLNAYDKYFLSGYPGSLAWDTETLYQPYRYSWLRISVWDKSGLPIDVGQSSAGACPTQELVDAYEVRNADGTKSVPVLDLANPYQADGTPNINPAAVALGYDDKSDKMYENRDPRFYSTIYYDGAKIQLLAGEFEVETRLNGNCGVNLSPTNKRNTCTGYYLRKFHNIQSGADAGNKDGFMRVFRVAELYLNFAEAAFKASGADIQFPATQVTEIILDEEGNETEQVVIYGTSMSAREAANAVRARVEMPGIDDQGDAFWLRLCNERRVELAFEEHRFFDVRRWAKPDQDLSATDKRVSGMWIEQKTDGTMEFRRFAFERECYTNKFLKYPVGLDEVRKMLDKTGENWQNQGWN